MTRAELPAVSLVIPVHNEAESLPVLWEEIKKVLAGLDVTVEVLFVDDGSDDGSDKVIRRFADEDSRVRGVHLGARRGVATAARSSGSSTGRDVPCSIFSPCDGCSRAAFRARPQTVTNSRFVPEVPSKRQGSCGTRYDGCESPWWEYSLDPGGKRS